MSPQALHTFSPSTHLGVAWKAGLTGAHTLMCRWRGKSVTGLTIGVQPMGVSLRVFSMVALEEPGL